MNKLLAFISRSRNFLLFLLLEVICFLFIFQSNSYQRATVINSSNALSGSVLNSYSSFTEYFSLKDKNESLAEENARLRSVVKSSYFATNATADTVSDSLYMQQYTFIAAKVISNSYSNRNNFLTLNKGKKHGIEKDMGVISNNGIIGVVTEVSDNYATVMSVLHKKQQINARFKKSNRYGTVEWQGGNYRYAKLNEIQKQQDVATGDTIITGSNSTLFPEGIPIGIVEEHTLGENNNFHNITIKFTEDYSNIKHVYAVKDLMKIERLELENSDERDE